MSSIGLNFRGTSGYVTDAAGDTYVLSSDAYPTTRGGWTFGWESGPAAGADRDNTNDPELAGVNGLNTGDTFRLDLPSSGAWDVRLALGDAASSQNIKVKLQDGTTDLVTHNVNPAAQHFFDATEVDRTAAAWPGANALATYTFSTTILRLVGLTGGATSVVAHVGVATAASISFNASPTDLPKNHSGNITLTLVGSGTSWAGGGSQFSVSGVTGVTKVSENVTSTTAATLVITTGSGTGTLTISDGTHTTTVTVSAATLGVSPLTVGTGTTPTLTLTGTHTVWSQETAAGLFSLSGGTGASIGTPTVTTDTAATAVLTAGTAAGTLTVTDTSTGVTATVTCVLLDNAVFEGDSLTYGQGASSGQGTVTGTVYPAATMASLGAAYWAGDNEGHSGDKWSDLTSQAAALDALINATSPVNLLFVLCGCNDIGGGRTAAQVYADAVTYCQARQAAGWTLVYISILPSAQIIGSSAFNAIRNVVNADTDVNWRSFADGYCAVHLDARIGYDGQELDGTFYQSDHVHMTDAGYAILGQLVAGAAGVAVYAGGSAGGGGGSNLLGGTLVIPG